MQDPQTVNLSEYWHFSIRLLKTRRWTILTFLTVTFLVVAIGTALQTRMYNASVTVLIDMEPPNVLTVSTTRDDSTMGQSNYLTYADYYRTQLEIIRGRRLAKKVFGNLKLDKLPLYMKQPDPVGTLKKQLTVNPIKQTRLVTLMVETPDPKLSAQIANEFAFVFVSDNLAKAAANEAVTLMKNEYLKLQSKEAELSKRYKAKFPAMIRLREQMNQLATSIEKELARQLSDEQTDTHLITEPESRKEEPPALSRTEQRAAGVLFHQLQENSMMGGLRPNNIRIQDLAQVPLKKTKPKVTLNLLLALILGLMGGIAAAAIEELFDSTLKVPKDIEREGRFTFLGHIPRIEPPVEPGKASVPPDSSVVCQHMHLKPNSETAEGYRVIRTNLIYAAGNNTRTLLFTSPGSGEGKTTTASNLAIAFSQLGLKVLLIDADLRNPSVHAGFGISQGPGLSEFLTGRNSFQEVIHRLSIPNLAIVPSGDCPSNPSELLALPKMQELLKLAEQKFDHVFIDTPPIVPVTDATILAALTKTVVAITQSGKTPRQALDRLDAGCKAVHAKVLGVILNNVTNFDVPVYGYGRQNYPYGKKASADPQENFSSTILRRARKAFQALKGKMGERKFFRGNPK